MTGLDNPWQDPQCLECTATGRHVCKTSPLLGLLAAMVGVDLEPLCMISRSVDWSVGQGPICGPWTATD